MKLDPANVKMMVIAGAARRKCGRIARIKLRVLHRVRA